MSKAYDAAGADAELDRVEHTELRGPVVRGEHEEGRLPVARDGLRVVPRGDQRLHLRLELRRHEQEAARPACEEPLVQVAYSTTLRVQYEYKQFTSECY